MYTAQGTVRHYTSLDLTDSALRHVDPAEKTWIIYFTCKCTLLRSALRLRSVGASCSIRKKKTTHTNRLSSQRAHREDRLVCTDCRMREWQHSFSLSLSIPASPLFLPLSSLFSAITSASLVFLFFLIHNSNVSQIWCAATAVCIQGRFYWCEFNMRFDAFIFTSAATSRFHQISEKKKKKSTQRTEGRFYVRIMDYAL